ncbi:hypothetical protein FSC37_09515 [Piscinibacter aquaticus]|uniref:Serine aminopeptidase S33 domain-containing protein n=1 Tax=Piscinibacter aquaticus TaxID=392597 RepID=A0A5C6U2T2_9BURK|nr:hypothetical protein FSC37_09515 [Piscinibacter aquaticus]
MRQLALRLGAAGFHTLRFDYHGTGDSSGDMTDADLPGWESDIEAALAELMDMTGAQRVGLVGLRLGAALAARVCARRRRQVDSLVLWDPVVDGAVFVDELLALDVATSGGPAPRPRPEGRPGLQLLGFPVTPAMFEQMKGVDLLGSVPNLPARTLVITSTHGASAALRERLAQRSEPAASCEELDLEPAWLEQHDSGAGAVPVGLLDRIAAWCSA